MHLFIPVFVWNVGQWLGQRKRLSSCAKVIKKTACRRTCEQSAELHLLQVDASVGEGSSWPSYSWKMNEIIDLSLWETTHEYWALTRDSQRDGNQNEKWGTTAERLRGEKKRERRQWGESGESMKRFIERDDWREGVTQRMERMKRGEYKTDGARGWGWGRAERWREKERESLIGQLLMMIGGDWSLRALCVTGSDTCWVTSDSHTSCIVCECICLITYKMINYMYWRF